MPDAYSRFAKLIVLAILLAVIAYFSFHPQSAPIIPGLSFQTVMGALGGIFIIVLLVERATEIVISIWRQSDADALKKEIEAFTQQIDLLTPKENEPLTQADKDKRELEKQSLLVSKQKKERE